MNYFLFLSLLLSILFSFILSLPLSFWVISRFFSYRENADDDDDDDEKDRVGGGDVFMNEDNR